MRNTLDKKSSILFLILFFAALIFPFFYWTILGETDKGFSDVENRNLKPFPEFKLQDFRTAVKRLFQGLPRESGEIFFNDILKGKFQNEYEQAMKDQFPIRESFLDLSALWEQANIKIIYSLLQDELIPASFDNDYFVTRDYEFIIEKPTIWSEDKRERLSTALSYFGQMKENFPNINFHFIAIEPIQNSPSHPSIDSYPNADAGKSIAYINENPPAGWQLNTFTIESFSQYKELFFKTDHHLNIHGGWKLYEKIYQLLSRSYENISPMLEPVDIVVIPDLEMLGSKARKALLDIHPEIFEYAIVDLPSHNVYVNSELAEYGSREDYTNGIFPTEKYTNHYGKFYGSEKNIIRYSFPSSPDRNLLIIADSYLRIVQDCIASHHRDTYIIDIRHIDLLDMNFSEILAEYEIDDVLVASSIDILTDEFPLIDF